MKLKKKLVIMFKIRVFLSNYSVKLAEEHLRQKKLLMIGYTYVMNLSGIKRAAKLIKDSVDT